MKAKDIIHAAQVMREQRVPFCTLEDWIVGRDRWDFPALGVTYRWVIDQSALERAYFCDLLDAGE